MQEPDDIALLRKYVEHDSEEAFAALVARHVNKVYSVALRHTRNPHQAEEITQAVFVILAKKSRQLGKRVILSGWLYQAARLTAVTFIRGEIRRARREQEAHMQTALHENESDAWTQIAPLLDAAMARLNETDRQAVVLRFFDGKSLREVGLALGAKEEAAKKRVSRALEKLRTYFAKRGVSATTATIAGGISAHSVQVAPAVLAKSVTAAALAKGAMVSGSTLSLIKGGLKLMAWTKVKMAIVVGAGVLFAAGTATVTVKEIAAHRTPAWQEKFDLSLLDGLTPQVKILPSLPFTVQSHIHRADGTSGKKLGWGLNVVDLLLGAYNVVDTRLILNAPIPEKEYDFIDTYSKMDDEMKGFQEEIKKKIGLTGRRVMIETNVLILTVQSPNAAGWKPGAGKLSNQIEPGSLSMRDVALYTLTYDLEFSLGTVVIDETGLKGKFDVDLKGGFHA